MENNRMRPASQLQRLSLRDLERLETRSFRAHMVQHLNDGWEPQEMERNSNLTEWLSTNPRGVSNNALSPSTLERLGMSEIHSLTFDTFIRLCEKHVLMGHSPNTIPECHYLRQVRDSGQRSFLDADFVLRTSLQSSISSSRFSDEYFNHQSTPVDISFEPRSISSRAYAIRALDEGNSWISDSKIDPFETVEIKASQAPRLIRDIVINKFSHLEESKRDAQIKAVQYIQNTAFDLGIDAQDWDAFKLFPNPESPDMITEDKTQINKVLFAKHSENQERISKTLAQSNPVLQSEIHSMEERILHKKIDGHRENLDYNLRKAKELHAQIDQYLLKAREDKVHIDLLNGKKIEIFSQLESIHKAGFWNIIGHDRAGIHFRNITPVIVNYRNESAGINLRVNFGTFGILLNPETSYLRVRPYKNNLEVNSHCHPHISNSGDVCWGNAAETASNYLASGNYSQLMALLSSVLKNYNDKNPYCSLEEFQAQDKVSAPPGVDVDSLMDDGNRCEVCENTEDDCDCTTCPSCENKIPADEACEQCCSECERFNDDCECCHVCGGRDIDVCECCQVCERSSSRCKKCKICDQHDSCNCCTDCNEKENECTCEGRVTI